MSIFEGYYSLVFCTDLQLCYFLILGLFPDVGGGYVLPRMRGKLGLYLALTGENYILFDSLFHGKGFELEFILLGNII